MNLSRRQALMYCTAGATAVALVGLGAVSPSMADDLLDKEINTFTGGKTPAAGKVTLTVPEIAENGNTVPVSVSVDSKMTDGDLVQSVMLVADANPFPSVATFNFTALGTAAATTRIRLAKTQNVIAIAKMADGSVYMDKKLVKVTIGGCGG